VQCKDIFYFHGKRAGCIYQRNMMHTAALSEMPLEKSGEREDAPKKI
jgi:hypothetical protein